MKLFRCQTCAQLLYFENRQCQRCFHRLGYLPAEAVLSAVEPEDGLWRALALPATRYRFCANAAYDTCNWLVPEDWTEEFCIACRHNRTIPDLEQPENLARWRKFELAKHRLFYTLIRLGLPLTSRAEDSRFGLVFDFLSNRSHSGGEEVMTGHENGLIAINLAEADDAEREKLRMAMGETYRTLLGHLRHESGHYFCGRLVRGTEWIEKFREFFGDERQDYGGALQSYYRNGPPQNWQQRHISAYAAAHPWEDFAETWAHYLHIVDTLEMAFAFGIHIHPGSAGKEAAPDFDPHDAGSLDRLIDAWLPLTFGGAVWLLRLLKALLIAQQYRHRSTALEE